MKLSELAGEPTLIEVVLDSEEVIEEYGEALTFHTWDRQPMDVFVKLASISDNDMGNIMETVTQIVLDEKGKPIINKKVTLPTKILMQVVGKVVELLGK